MNEREKLRARSVRERVELAKLLIPRYIAESMEEKVGMQEGMRRAEKEMKRVLRGNRSVI